MKNWKIFIIFVSLLTVTLGNSHSVSAQQNLAQQATRSLNKVASTAMESTARLQRKSSLITQHSSKLERLFRGNRLNPNSISGCL